jgi:hypothetical protein
LNKHRSEFKLLDEEPIDSFSMYYQLLEERCFKLEQGFAAFLDKLEEAGWDKHLIILKVPNRLIISDERKLR